jgi:transcriptional regulator with XRE-family HTH domain
MNHTKKVVCRLQQHRMHWNFSVSALAEVLGGFSRAHIARVETGEGSPSLRLAFACQVLFGVPLDLMFPHIYAEVEDETRQCIAKAHKELLESTHPPDLHRRDLLALALQRGTNRSTAEGV